MRTVRRLYLYAIALISLETVLWGVINLIRGSLQQGAVGGGAGQLAGALALVTVGLPVFLIHWWLAQRGAGRDAEERRAGLRAVFLYVVMGVLAVPVVQNGLAIVNRLLLLILSLDPQKALLGGQQTWSDNLVAAVINALVFIYFYQVASLDRKTTEAQDRDNMDLVRRGYRYMWVLYGLAMLAGGLQQTLRYIIDRLGLRGVELSSSLANGLALVLVGLAVWLGWWRLVQRSLVEQDENRSLFRLAIIYALTFAGMAGVLIPTGRILYEVLLRVLGSGAGTAWFVSQLAGPLSTALPLGGIWLYYSRVLRVTLASVPDTPRRDGIGRLYFYVTAFAGWVTAFIGLQNLARFVIDAWLVKTVTLAAARSELAGALAALVLGLAIWLRTWPAANRLAAAQDERGDHARRSVVRKSFLYLSLFIGVIGVMISAGALIYQILIGLLGEPGTSTELAQTFKTLVLFIGLTAYYWQVLRLDNRRAGQTLAAKHSLFPVLVLEPGDGSFSEAMVAALREASPEIPVAVHGAVMGAPPPELENASAVILPAGLAAGAAEALRLWLQNFKGPRLVVPLAAAGWLWVDAPAQPARKFGDQVAALVRRLAEGQEALVERRTSPWVIVGAILGGLLVIQILVGVFGILFRGF